LGKGFVHHTPNRGGVKLPGDPPVFLGQRNKTKTRGPHIKNTQRGGGYE